MAEPVLSRTTLNRTLLARQHLLERARVSVAAMLEHLVGMQAQEPQEPYPSLWSRVAGFRPEDLGALLESGDAVRISSMRATIHLHTRADAARVCRVTQDVMERVWRSSGFAKQLAATDVAEVVAAARALVAAEPLTVPALRAALAQRWPDADPQALAYAARFHLPLVQRPPRGLWGRRGKVVHGLLELDEDASAPWLLERYLRAYGPATAADARSWSRLTGAREAIEALGDRVRVLRDEDGRELFDVADGVVADPAVAAPVRLLGQFDDLCLAHEDRSRVIPPAHDAEMRKMLGHPVVLLDGWVRGRWAFTDGGIQLHPWDDWSLRHRRAATAEARRLLRWARPGRDAAVTF